jgi:hypothetical protein
MELEFLVRKAWPNKTGLHSLDTRGIFRRVRARDLRRINRGKTIAGSTIDAMMIASV